MTDQTTPILDGLDPELLQHTVSRRDALGNLAGTLTRVAVASAPLMLGVMARSAVAQSGSIPQGIRDVLNFALTLEYLEDEFYKAGLAAQGLIPGNARAVFAQIGKHETAHVELLRSVLGSNAVAKPTFDFTAGGAFGDVFTNYQTFLALAQGFEDTGVRAYKGQAANLITDNGTLTVALQIHSVEARHASQVRRMRNQKGWITNATTNVPALAAVYAGDGETTQAGVNTAPFASAAAASEAFDEPLSREAVLAIAGMFIVG